jgi:predicted aspartyl protease
MTFLLAAVALSPQAISAPVSVPFRFGEDAIIVDAHVNNRKVSLMFDTGFSGTVVMDSNVNIGKPSGTMMLRDFVGQFQASTVAITSFKLGGMDIKEPGLEAVMAPGGDYSVSYNTHCDGILGFGPLSRQTLEINFQRQQFIFHPKSLDITKRVPDNEKTFLIKLLPSGHQSLELEVLTSDGKRMTMALDTGNAFYATTHRDVLERVGLWDGTKTPKFTRSSYVASGEVATWYKRMKDVKIFGIPVSESVWSIIDLPSSSAESDGTIGFGFLKNFNITIDFERRRIWMENFTGKLSEAAVADIGVIALVDPSVQRARVARVAPASPADKAGIKRGDMILSIDGADELNLGFRKLNRMFEGEKGSKVKLVLSRSGNLMRLEVEREFLIND